MKRILALIFALALLPTLSPPSSPAQTITLQFYTHVTPIPPSSGWTDLVPSADSRIIYVSSSGGNDSSNDGLSPGAPKQTINAGLALLRDGYPDHLLLKCGDTFNSRIYLEAISGRSSSERMVISSYGTGARPIINGGTQDFGFETNGYGNGSDYRCNHIACVGIEFYADQRDPAIGAGVSPTLAQIGIYLTYTEDLLIEDCKTSFFRVNVQLGACKDITIRRCVNVDAYDQTEHSQGIYADGVAGTLLVEENLFDHNGWNETAGLSATSNQYSHNLYIKENVSGLIFRNNYSLRAGSHGIQARSGGDVQGNLFLDNSIHMSYGLQNSGMATPGGVTGTVSGNVYCGSKLIQDSSEGSWAVEFGNISSATFSGNLIYGDSLNHPQAAIQISYGSPDDSPDDIGVNNLTISDNVVYGWYSLLEINSQMIAGSGNGRLSLSNLTIADNDFQGPLTGPIVSHGIAFDGDEESWSGNRYFWSADTSTWFALNGVTTSLAAWLATVDATGSNTNVAYVDTSRTVASYNGSIGGTATKAAFIAALRGQSKANWNDSLKASEVVAYLKGGFSE